ncbi:hypothetical protein FOXYSP1_08307 [Fusarium oxysporum f. sp. phaseoli]
MVIVRLQMEKLELKARRIRNPDGGTYTTRQLREMVSDLGLLLAQVIVVFASFHPDNSHYAPRNRFHLNQELGKRRDNQFSYS